MYYSEKHFLQLTGSKILSFNRTCPSVSLALNMCSFFWLTKTTGWLYLTMGKKWILFASMTQCKIDLTGNAYHLLLDMCNVQILTSQSKS